MFESLLRVPNLCWQDDRFNAIDDPTVATAHGLANVNGRFAVAHQDEDTIVLARDKLGLNKLFVAIDPARGLVIANYLTDLLRTGIGFDAISAVPAGATVHVDLTHGAVITDRFYQLPHVLEEHQPHASVFARAKQELVSTFELLAADFANAKIVVCLSGGLDSALIAALAARYFTDVTAYTYTYTSTGAAKSLSHDALAAEQLAPALGLAFRLVSAGEDGVLAVLPGALRHGQDWRDFNVHCAIVNELLADAIASDMAQASDARPVVVLTGDLMNEIVADYSPVAYQGNDYYLLPDLPPARLRPALLNGIQTGDREIGVFSSRGLTVAQPYAHIFETLLQLPDPIDKINLIRALAGDLLPPWAYQNTKIRAQIGDLSAQEGILPLLINSGRDSRWLRSAFCRELGIPNPDVLRTVTRAGTYRPPTEHLWSAHEH